MELGFKPNSRNRATWRAAGICGACCPICCPKIDPPLSSARTSSSRWNTSSGETGRFHRKGFLLCFIEQICSPLQSTWVLFVQSVRSPRAADCCCDIRHRLAGRRLTRSLWQRRAVRERRQLDTSSSGDHLPNRSDLVGPVWREDKHRVGGFLLGHRVNLFAKLSLVHGRILSSAPAESATVTISSSRWPKDPWKDLDPQRGDFDAELDQAQVEIHEGNPDAELSILVSRASEMRALLRHARPHGGNAVERVKQARPDDRNV